MMRVNTGKILVAAAVSAVLACGVSGQAFAGAREQAKRIHDRIAGVPPSTATLDAMEAKVSSGDAAGAARIAMTAPSFYTTTLKNWITPWTNRDQSAFQPLNDYTATVIGIVRDDVDYRQVLSGDILYIGGAGFPAYSPTDNNLYQALEDQDVNLGDTTKLVASTQSGHTGLPPEATAGIMTTRAAAQSFFINGTNRAMFRFTLMSQMCRDMEQMLDVKLPPDHIRQDVARSPGGDSRVFLNNCIGCHSGMDSMAEAFAYYNFNADSGRIEYTAGQVQPKYLINSDNFKPGFVTPDDGWHNYWRQGQNSVYGWNTSLPGSGNGAKSMGAELANSDQFARCAVEKVFKTVCLHPPVNAADRASVDSTINTFKNGGYKLKDVFAQTAAYCKGN
jgi:hypothetical protein